MQDPCQIQQRSGGLSIDVVVTILTTSPELERRDNESKRSCGGYSKSGVFRSGMAAAERLRIY